MLGWDIVSDGVVIESGKLTSLNIKPGKDTLLIIPVEKIQPLPGTEYFLNLSATRDDIWTIVPDGNIYATEQFKLTFPTPVYSKKGDVLTILEKKTVGTNGASFRLRPISKDDDVLKLAKEKF